MKAFDLKATSPTTVNRRLNLKLPKDLADRLAAAEKAVKARGGSIRIEDGVVNYLSRQVRAIEKELQQSGQGPANPAPSQPDFSNRYE